MNPLNTFQHSQVNNACSGREYIREECHSQGRQAIHYANTNLFIFMESLDLGTTNKTQIEVNRHPERQCPS